MTLFSAPNDPFSHRTRIVLAEKGISIDIVSVDSAKFPEDLLDLNPYHSVPTLVDRDLVLYDSRVIIEYLDERFPHQGRMREALVEIFDDDARVVQHQIPVHQRGHAVVGVEIEQVLRKAPGFDAHDIDADAFFGQHDARAMTPRVIGRGKQCHDGSSARQIPLPRTVRRKRPGAAGARATISARPSSTRASPARRAR